MSAAAPGLTTLSTGHERRRGLVLDATGLSHRGLVRASNDDYWFADGDLGLAMVADGVGGHANGALASLAAVTSIAAYIRRAMAVIGNSRLLKRETQMKALALAIKRANRRLITSNEARDADQHGGTTVVGIWAPYGLASLATLFHIGDSRLYRLRNGELQALTRDHSAYQHWCDSGRHGAPPPKNYILQALGLSRVAPDIANTEVEPGDRFLLCTDGLTNYLSDLELKDALVANPADSTACDRLISLGLERGGNDNLTAVLCAFAQSEDCQPWS